MYVRFFCLFTTYMFNYLKKNRTTLDIKKRLEHYAMKGYLRKIKLHRRHLNPWNLTFTYISQYLKSVMCLGPFLTLFFLLYVTE